MSTIKVLGILCSPRRGGNSEVLLDSCLKSAEESGAETQKIALGVMDFVPCLGCARIRKDGRCRIEDDMQKVYTAIEQTDSIVIASPIFFGSLTAQCKMMIDRFQCQWLAMYVFKTYKILKEKKGVFLCVEASDKRAFFENARAIIKNFFATVGASYNYELFCPHVDKKEEMNSHPDCIKKAEDIGRSLLKKG